jgi:hypothetical protein
MTILVSARNRSQGLKAPCGADLCRGFKPRPTKIVVAMGCKVPLLTHLGTVNAPKGTAVSSVVLGAKTVRSIVFSDWGNL